MEWIASMPGPLFLGLYSAIICVVLVSAWAAARSSPEILPAPMVPANPDPYEVAYLRGGEREVGRLAVIDLTDRGYLQESKVKGREGKSRLKVSSQAPKSNLTPGLSRVLSLFQARQETLESMLRLPELREATAEIVRPFAMRYDEQFLAPRSRILMVRMFGMAVILGFGGYKLAVALARGHTNVIFLCLLTLIALPILWKVTQSRLNAAGQAFLAKIQSAYSELKTKPKIDARPLAHADLMLVVALFGAPVLLGGADVHFAHMLGTSAMRESGYTGGSCSSCSSSDSGGGDGGCGGGCGGCGGD